MDNSGREIPITEDDMGEGYVEVINNRENEEDKEQRRQWHREEKLRRKQKYY